jgi:uncharacterized membrane protein YgcG
VRGAEDFFNASVRLRTLRALQSVRERPYFLSVSETPKDGGAEQPLVEEETMTTTQRILMSAFAVLAMCATSAPVLSTSAQAQQRYYRDSHRNYYYAPRSHGYYNGSAAYSRGYGGYYGGGGSYGGSGSNGANYSSIDSNGQRRTGSDVGNFGSGM